jgi:hypothetical protein
VIPKFPSGVELLQTLLEQVLFAQNALLAIAVAVEVVPPVELNGSAMPAAKPGSV